MGDIDNRDAGLTQFPDDIEQRLGFQPFLLALPSRSLMLLYKGHPALGAFARTALHHFRVHRAGVLHRVFHVVHAVMMLRRRLAARYDDNACAKRQNF